MTLFVDESRPHLGGFLPGGDEATYFPDLWEWLVKDYGMVSVVDVGCGEGRALDAFTSAGAVRVLGIDGIAQPHKLIVEHDFTTGPPLVDYFSMCWCCEFVEHIEERYLPNVLRVFEHCDYVLMTHAFPGQPGHHHVNLRTADYWIGVMAAIGYHLDKTLTVVTRELASVNRHPLNHFVRSGMAFRRS